MGHLLRTLNPEAADQEQANLERAAPDLVLSPQVLRISPRVMTILGDQMRIGPASHTMGIGAAGVWTVCRLMDGRIAVGSFGHGLLTAEEVAEAIKAFQALLHDGLGRDTVGS